MGRKRALTGRFHSSPFSFSLKIDNPMALLFGFLDFIYPLYASECGMSPLMLSNIMVIGLALNLLFRKPLNNYYASIGTKRSLVVQSGIISATLLMLALSPNIIWMTAICLAIYVLKMNSYVILYQVEVIERNGFRQQEVQSDCLLADQILRTVRMPLVRRESFAFGFDDLRPAGRKELNAVISEKCVTLPNNAYSHII